MFERLERGARRELGSANGEAQPVARHRIDEAGGIAGEEQTVEPAVADFDGQRSEDDGRADQPRARKSIAKHGIARQLAEQRRARIAEARSPGRQGFTRHTLVRPPGTGAMPM